MLLLTRVDTPSLSGLLENGNEYLTELLVHYGPDIILHGEFNNVSE